MRHVSEWSPELNSKRKPRNTTISGTLAGSNLARVRISPRDWILKCP
jgi:hypothetical protein